MIHSPCISENLLTTFPDLLISFLFTVMTISFSLIVSLLVQLIFLDIAEHSFPVHTDDQCPPFLPISPLLFPKKKRLISLVSLASPTLQDGRDLRKRDLRIDRSIPSLGLRLGSFSSGLSSRSFRRRNGRRRMIWRGPCRFSVSCQGRYQGQNRISDLPPSIFIAKQNSTKRDRLTFSSLCSLFHSTLLLTPLGSWKNSL
jgi:hypothetical protein